jgi:GTP pyrophosphokinase
MVRRDVVDFDGMMEEVRKYIKREENIKLIEKAYQCAYKNHVGQFRKSGEAYIVHPIQVGYILAMLRTGPKTIAAGLLHDVLEDCCLSREEMSAEFGEEVTELVEAVTKIGALKFQDEKEYQAKNHRKIFIAMAKDIRVILIKLSDRLHNMRTLQFMSEAKQKKIASETLEVYAPIAHRLGINDIKIELEDLCFQYIDKTQYYEIARLVEKRKVERDDQIQTMISDISSLLDEHQIQYRIFGRSKHLYSIYKKMVTKNKRFEEILDLQAIRVITDTKNACYEILGYIHAFYRPIPGRFKDYIATPKVNMYQSLHTTIVGEDGNIFEVQIRTEEMDEIAEQGVAAHWRYKEGKKYSVEAEQKEIDKTITDLQAKLAKTEKEGVELRYLFDKLRTLSQITELDPVLVNTLIKRIEIHDKEKRDGKNYVKVDIYFTAIGMFDIPSEKEINAVMRRMESGRETA